MVVLLSGRGAYSMAMERSGPEMLADAARGADLKVVARASQVRAVFDDDSRDARPSKPPSREPEPTQLPEPPLDEPEATDSVSPWAAR